jgi:hypothetical protein
MTSQAESVMRIGIVSDIHGNRTAFEAGPTPLQRIGPIPVLHPEMI